ncbi:MAG: LysR family transcriptional regulator [Pseudomonadota bacterium]
MIDEISIFLAVVDAGSLSKVARERAMAVSSVSRKIDALEQEMGVKLLHRTSRLLMPTDAGEQFLPRARAIISELDDARHDISAASADPRGLLTIAAPSSFGRRHVAPAVISFMQLYPAIEVVLHLGDEVLDLRAQRVDVAIRIGKLPDSDLVATRLAPVRRIACASPGYIARAGRPRSPQDLVDHNCLTMATLPVPVDWWCFRGVNRGAPLPVKGSLRTDDTETLLQAAIGGIGIIHLSSWLLSEPIVAGQLLPLFPLADVELPGARFGVNAVRMPGRSHAAKARLFVAHLRSAFGEPCYWDSAMGLA